MNSRNYNGRGHLVSKLLYNRRFSESVEGWMRSFLINKNLSLYYWLKKRIRKKWAFRVVGTIEKVILMFGREVVPCSNKNWVLTREQESGLRSIDQEE